MKKNFFKKLSFVLALAMVLSVVAPAAAAFAAAGPKLNSTKKYLHLGVEDLNEFNFNVSNKKSGWKYSWESKNEDVVVVNKKNGVVTATGVGTAKVTVSITDKKNEEIKDLTATVIVRDNIKEVTITGKPEGDKLAVGVENDFNRNFVTNSGSTKKTSAITRWTVEPADGATIADNGVFVATKAGKYTVTANAFQSKAKFESWKKDAVANADLVLDTDTYEVNVSASMVSAKQVDNDTVKVTFDAAVADADKNLVVYQMVGTSKVKQLVKEVKLDADKKVADVTVYVPFVAEATYTVEYPEMDSQSFVAATKKAEDVAYIKIDTATAVVGETKDISVKLFNANDVEITDGTGLSSRVEIKAEDVAGAYVDTNAKQIIIFEKGVSVKVDAIYHSYNWDSTTGEEKGNLTATAVILGVDATSTDLTGLKAWTMVKANDEGTYSPDFSKAAQIIAVEDAGYRLFVQFDTKNGNNTATINSKDKKDEFVFETSDNNVLIVAEDGTLHPVKQGTVDIIVKHGTGNTKTPVGVVRVTVGAKSKASSLVLGQTYITLSNKIADSADVTLKLTDQTGRTVSFVAGDIDVTKVSGNGDVQFTKANDKVTFNSTNAVEGTYSYKIKVKDVERYVTVKIVTADADADVAKYALELGATTIDVKAENNKTDKTVSINLFALAANGTKIEKVTFDNTKFRVDIDAPYVNGHEWDYDNENRGPEFDLAANTYTVSNGVSGSAITKAPVGTYKVTVYEFKDHDKKADTANIWVAIATKSFVVEDTQAKPALSKVKTLTFNTADDNATIRGIVADCFEIKLNGTEMTDIVGVEVSGTAKQIFVKSITVRQNIEVTGGNAHIDHKVNIGQTIVYKQ